MHITGIGINGDGRRGRFHLDEAEEDLTFFQRCGFDAVEIPVHQLDLIVGGRLRREEVDKVRATLDAFDFAYSVHSPERLNLAFPQKDSSGQPELALEQDVFLACLDFCAAIGAKVMVYHSGLIALYGARFGLEPIPDDGALELAREQEISALKALMPLAVERGVVIAMENRDPHPWEVAVLASAGLPPDKLLKYHAGMAIPGLVRQIEAVNHPDLGLTLDYGHLFLAAHQCGFDYLDAVRQAAPHVRHVHASDNCGRLGGVFDGLKDRIPYGDGDLHMPPGWGTIPHQKTLAQLPDYKGLCILEIRSRFSEHFPTAVQDMRRLLDEVAGRQHGTG